jgi:hypothetical protein
MNLSDIIPVREAKDNCTLNGEENPDCERCIDAGFYCGVGVNIIRQRNATRGA